MPNVSQIFAQTLKKVGIRFVFGVPSGNMIDYIEALRNEPGIDFVLVAHETTAAIMADVCGRLTGIPGVCFGTFGPGATNISTGVGEAFLDRSPVIAFTDEMPESLLHRTVQMNIDHQQLFKPITKLTMRLDAENVEAGIRKAAKIAASEVPGPVHIGVPAGIGLYHGNEKYVGNSHEQINKNVVLKKSLVNAFQKSKRPVLAIGLSAVRHGLEKIIIKIAEKFQLPVVLTPMAKGMFPENHTLYAGVLFHALSNMVGETYSQADLVIGIGYDPVEFNYESWMPNVPLIHFDSTPADVDKSQIREIYNETGTLKASLKLFLDIECSEKSWDIHKLLNRKEKIFQKLTPEKNNFGPLALVHELRKKIPDNAILSVDVGAHLHLIGQQWRTPAPQKLLMTNGWSGMGFSIPAALAAKITHPELTVVSVIGDGGFLMTCGELATAKRLNLKIIFIVIIDNSLSLIRIKQEKKEFDNFYGTNLEKLSKSPTNHYFGVPVLRAENLNEYSDALSEAMESEEPVVIEAIVDGSEYDDLVLKPNK